VRIVTREVSPCLVVEYVSATDTRGTRLKVWNRHLGWRGDPRRLRTSWDNEWDFRGNACHAVSLYLLRCPEYFRGEWLVSCFDSTHYVAVRAGE